MIAITADVSNALARYRRYYGVEIRIGDIPTSYVKPEDLVSEIDDSIASKTPIFGGVWRESDVVPSRKKKPLKTAEKGSAKKTKIASTDKPESIPEPETKNLDIKKTRKKIEMKSETKKATKTEAEKEAKTETKKKSSKKESKKDVKKEAKKETEKQEKTNSEEKEKKTRTRKKTKTEQETSVEAKKKSSAEKNAEEPVETAKKKRGRPKKSQSAR